MIEVEKLSKYYGDIKAIEDVSFSIEKGKVVGFLGPNGAGKTTTIRILTCFIPASSGKARIAGYDVLTQSMKVRDHLGYLPESVPLYNEMRVYEYLRFRGRLRGLDRSTLKKRIDYVVKECWLEDVYRRPIGQLSKGYRQRVGLADALLHDPEVLILDEPTVGLDPAQVRAIRELIKQLGRRHTILFSSHILPEVEAICEEIIIISAGRIVACGSPDELRRDIREKSRLILEVKAGGDDVLQEIRKLKDVSAVEVLSQNGYLRLAISSSSGKDLREEVAALVSNRGWLIRELKLEVASLEDFFVRVVAEQRR